VGRCWELRPGAAEQHVQFCAAHAGRLGDYVAGRDLDSVNCVPRATARNAGQAGVGERGRRAFLLQYEGGQIAPARAERIHSALGYATPRQYAALWGAGVLHRKLPEWS